MRSRAPARSFFSVSSLSIAANSVGTPKKMRRIVLVHQREHQRRRRPLGIEHGGGADRHREGQRVAEAVGEEQFCRRQADIVLADAEHLLGVGLRGRGEVGMQMPHALGHAGRARRIEPERRLVGDGCAAVAKTVAFAGEFVGRASCGRAHRCRRRRRARDPASARPCPSPPAAALRRRTAPARGNPPAHRHIDPTVSSVLSGTGTMPARIAPRNTTGKSTVSSMIIATRSSRRTPSRRSRLATRQALLLQVAIGQLGDGVGEGELVAAALVDIAVEQPGHRVVRTLPLMRVRIVRAPMIMAPWSLASLARFRIIIHRKPPARLAVNPRRHYVSKHQLHHPNSAFRHDRSPPIPKPAFSSSSASASAPCAGCAACRARCWPKSPAFPSAISPSSKAARATSRSCCCAGSRTRWRAISRI